MNWIELSVEDRINVMETLKVKFRALFAPRRVYAINKRSPLPQNDSPLKGFDYSGLLPQNISFIPPEDIIDSWRSDYNAMRESMIYGDPLPFDALITRIKELNERFKKIQ